MVRIRCQEPTSGTLVEKNRFRFLTPFPERKRLSVQADRDSGDAGPLQSGHEVGVLGGVQAVLEDRLDRRLLASHQGGWIEPQAGKYRAAQDAVRRRGHQLEAPFAVHEPVDLAIKDPPDDVLADAVAPVGVQLFPEVVTGAAGRDFRDQLGRSLYVIILADAGLSTPLGPDDQVSGWPKIT